jgi:CheY-like chemotaxis protein/anti-sigma regulatory factor (Ser/Thr protein kinase)
MMQGAIAQPLLFPGAENHMSTAARPPGQSPPTVLIVDDSPADQLLAGKVMQETVGWKVVYASSGIEALAVLEREHPAVVLTDLLMPGMNGLELVETIHRQHPLLPVVLMTAHGSEDMALQALRSGAASYVPKRSLSSELADTIEQVLSAAQSHRQQQRMLECLIQLDSHFVLDNDRDLIPPLVAYFQDQMTRFHLCDASTRVRVGVALEEAVLNAIYHGNLEVSSELRQQNEDEYHHLADERRRQSPYRERRIFLDATVSRTRGTFVVRDEGPGFNPSTLPDPTDPANLERTSGRGLLLIQTFMDEVTYNPSGNELRMVKHRDRSKRG